MSHPALESLIAAGVAHQRKGEYAQADKCYRQVLKKEPRHAGAIHLSGLLAYQQGRIEEAERLIRRAIALDPSVPDFHSNLGEVLRARGKFDEAVALLSRWTAKCPDNPGLWHNLGYTLLDANRAQEALEPLARSLRMAPVADGFYILGRAYLKLKRHDQAMEEWRKGLLLNPRHAHMLSALGDVLRSIGQIAKAKDTYEAAMKLAPPNFGLPFNAMAGLCRISLGQLDRAVALHREAMAREPARWDYHSNLLLTLLYRTDLTPAQVLAEHREWDRLHGRPAHVFTHAPRPPGARRLRIGYLSEDFRDHVVAYFWEPLARHHDHAAVEVFCYADVADPDDHSRRMEAYADHWVPVATLSNDELARRIHADGVDILVDLGGHTGGGKRLPVLAAKPAPLQATWLGYPATTGMASVDYRLVDDRTDPPGMTEAQNTEELVRLPGCFLCYEPRAVAPAVADPPCLGGQGVVFGCFNNSAKLNAVWAGLAARILTAVPGSRLMIKSVYFFDDDGPRERMTALFAAHGIGPERLVVLPRDKEEAVHLGRYHAVDIALDTFPYAGTTTTCEALWMGVPVVTLAGDTHVSRVGASLLAAAGLPELVATTPEDYVRRAVELAADPARLKALRHGLRARMADLTDGRAFAAKMERAYQTMARRKWG